MNPLVVPLTIALLSGVPLPAAPAGKRQQLADEARERVVIVTRALTMAKWSEQLDDALAGMGARHGLGSKWSSSEPHWKMAHEKVMTIVGRAFDDLKDAPAARERIDAAYQINFTEADAAEVLTLSKAERQKLDNRLDVITVTVALMEDHPALKDGTAEFSALLDPLEKEARLTPDREELKAPISKKALRAYEVCREGAVRFLRTAIDGQLELFLTDHHEQVGGIMASAVLEAAKSK